MASSSVIVIISGIYFFTCACKQIYVDDYTDYNKVEVLLLYDYNRSKEGDYKGMNINMDFKSYITEIEKQLERMTESQKNDWIYAQARTIDEDKRQNFLDDLSGKKNMCTELTVEAISDWCRQVEEGKIYFKTESCEYYEEGAWDSNWKVEYHDIFDAIPYLVKAIKTCHQLLMLKEYDTAYRLLDRICRLKFCDDYDEVYDYEIYCDGEGMSIENLNDEGLVSINFRKLSLCLLYACYQSNAGQSRMEKVYEYLTWDMCKGIVITDVFAFGPEKIEDEADFMKEWRTYLIPVSGDRAVELLVDACIYLGKDDYLLKTARENVKEHPSLYKVCCERKYLCEDYVSCIEIAGEAIDIVGKNQVIRADIADIAVKASKKEKNKLAEEKFIKEAFYSNPNSWHLLRLYKLKDRTVIEKALEQVKNLKEVSILENKKSMEQKETKISGKGQRIVYSFLLGDYAAVLQQCKKDKSYLGWSSALKGTIIPLLLLYLKNDKEQKTRAEINLIECMRYNLEFENMEGEPFEEYLSIWRKTYNMPEEHKQKCCEWLLEEIDKRTEAVVGGGYRKSYYKAAELIVLMGEIQEERGEVNGMQKLIDYYKKQHSRKRAFKEEIDVLAKKIYI